MKLVNLRWFLRGGYQEITEPVTVVRQDGAGGYDELFTATPIATPRSADRSDVETPTTGARSAAEVGSSAPADQRTGAPRGVRGQAGAELGGAAPAVPTRRERQARVDQVLARARGGKS